VFRCERCGTSYDPMRAAPSEHCPRCLIRDQVNARLSFRMFKLPEPTRRTGSRGAVPTTTSHT
jgi:DNA-directed RNA polymerase subunit RPC12/RpoP